MGHINAVIVEDNLEAREALISLLGVECPQVNVIGQADNQSDAYDSIIKSHPNLVFLDIQLREGTSFELLERLAQEHLIDFEIIFVTAYGRFEYATKAIEYSALGFINKPIDSEKLRNTVLKVKHRVDNKQYVEQIALLLEYLRKPSSVSRRVAFHQVKGIIEFTQVDDILFLEAEGPITNIHLLKDRKITAVKNLGHYSKLLLSDYNFFQISNKYVINLDHLKQFHQREHSIQLIDGTSLVASRRHGGKLKTYLNTHDEELRSLQGRGIQKIIRQLFRIFL